VPKTKEQPDTPRARTREAEATVPLSSLRLDPRNARRHGEANVGMMVASLEQVGAGRSIVIDENDVILAGNGIVEAAGKAGIERVQVVEADGKTLIAVRRTGLTPEQKQRLALYGSGPQLIAGEQTGRRVFAMELEPKYIAVALERWAKMTGKTPYLVAP